MFSKINSEKFFNKLYDDKEFCEQLGKVILMTSKLELELINLIENIDINQQGKLYNLTIGALISKIEKLKVLPDNLIEILKRLAEERNYLTHNIYLIMSNNVNDDILINSKKSHEVIKKNLLQIVSDEKNELLYDDVSLYTERAYILIDNLKGMISIIKRYKLNTK